MQTLLAFPAGDNPERDYVFRSASGGPLDPDNVDRAFGRHLTLAGLPRVRFHDLRAQRLAVSAPKKPIPSFEPLPPRTAKVRSPNRTSSIRRRRASDMPGVAGRA